MSKLTEEELEALSGVNDHRQRLKFAFAAGHSLGRKTERELGDITANLNVEAEIVIGGFNAFCDRFEEIL